MEQKQSRNGKPLGAFAAQKTESGSVQQHPQKAVNILNLRQTFATASKASIEPSYDDRNDKYNDQHRLTSALKASAFRLNRLRPRQSESTGLRPSRSGTTQARPKTSSQQRRNLLNWSLAKTNAKTQTNVSSKNAESTKLVRP